MISVFAFPLVNNNPGSKLNSDTPQLVKRNGVTTNNEVLTNIFFIITTPLCLYLVQLKQK